MEENCDSKESGDALHKNRLHNSVEEIKYYPHPFLSDSMVLDVRNSSKLWKTWHETYTIGFVDETNQGWSDNVSRGRSFSMTARDLFAFEPGEGNTMLRVS